MDITSSVYKVRQCSKCFGNTEFFCLSCPCDLCSRCSENHVCNHTVFEQDIMICREKLNSIPKQDMCVRHPRNVCEKYCEQCNIFICQHCTGHRKHPTQEGRKAYETKRKHYRLFIRIIKREVLVFETVLAGIEPDYKTWHRNISICRSKILTKAKELEERFEDISVCDKHRCLNQMVQLRLHLIKLQTFEHKYVHSSKNPVTFLLYLKKTWKENEIFETFRCRNHCRLSMTDTLIKKNVFKTLSEIQETERKERSLGDNRLSTLMSVYELGQSLTVTCVPCCFHVSSTTFDRVWVSYGKNIIFINTAGDILHRVKDLCAELYSGLHTITLEDELIYINREFKIMKLSKDLKITSRYIKMTDTLWRPRCVFISQITGHLLVGMVNDEKWKGKVVRYNQIRQIQTIQKGNAGLDLYRYPNYITENNNGDVVVSDLDWSGAVVVTDRRGVHLFTYTGHPSGTEIRPHGICTDALSRILVCDTISESVHMLDRNGHFISFFLAKSEDIIEPCSLSFDSKTNRVWVGSYTDKVFVYRINTKQEF